MWGPTHPERAKESSQSVLIRGVREVGELTGGVTGALIEPPCIYWCRNFEDEADDAEERFLSHGIREFPSPFMLAAYEEEPGLGNEEEPGLGLYEVHGLGW